MHQAPVEMVHHALIKLIPINAYVDQHFTERHAIKVLLLGLKFSKLSFVSVFFFDGNLSTFGIMKFRSKRIYCSLFIPLETSKNSDFLMFSFSHDGGRYQIETSPLIFIC